MKKYFLLLFAICLQSLLFAQKANQFNKAPLDTLYYEDFDSTGRAGNFFLPPSWKVVNNSPTAASWEWSAMKLDPPFSFSSAANGYLALIPFITSALVDSYIQSDLITIPPKKSVEISWEQNLFAIGPSSVTFLELSLDSINWTSYDASLGRSLNSNSGRVSFNISNFLGSDTSFYLRFRWTGGIGFHWRIDDLLIHEGYKNAISVEDFAINFHDTSKVFKFNSQNSSYSSIPFSSGASSVDDLNVSVVLKNSGLHPINASRVKVSLYEDGTCDGASSPLGLLSTAIDSSSRFLSASEFDTIRNILIPNSLTGGNYRLRIEALTDSTNEASSSAIKEYPFFYGDTVYAKDRGNISQSIQAIGNFQGDFIGESFTLNDGSFNTVTSLSFYVPNDSSILGMSVIPKLYAIIDTVSFSDSTVGPELISNPNPTVITSSLLGSWLTLPFSASTRLDSGTYLAGIENASPNRRLLVGEDPTIWKVYNSTCYLKTNLPPISGGPRWNITSDKAAIRLNFGLSARCINTSLEDNLENTSTLMLYPNPTNGLLNLDLGENQLQSLEIRNTLGALVYKQQLTKQQMELNLRYLEKGLYFVSLIGENSREVKKIIIQ